MNDKKTLSELTLISSGVWGSIALSGGIIAILAHNWDDFSHPVRVLLSIIPVIIGLTVFGYAYLNHHSSKVWMESSSVFLILMLGSSIGLIAQIYHMGGDFSRFLFYWMLFSIPVLYIGNSLAATMLYIAGITWWFILEWYSHFNIFEIDSSLRLGSVWYWILLSAIVPYFLFQVKPGNVPSLKQILLGWALVCSFSITGKTAYGTDHYWHSIFFLLMLYLLGKYYYNKGKYFWQRPFQTFAIFSTLSYVFYFSFRRTFHQRLYSDNYFNHNGTAFWFYRSDKYDLFLLYFNHLLLVAFIAACLYFYKKLKSGNIQLHPVQLLFPFFMILPLATELFELHVLTRILFNLYLIGYSCWYIYHGLKSGIPAIIAWALFVMTVLLFVRYFDMDISFWLKGIIYLCIGSLALLFNKFYSERIKL